DVPGTVRVRGVLNVGGVPGNPLSVRSLSIALLFAGVVRRSAAQLVRREARVVSGLASVVARIDYPLGARRLSADVLLLPRRLLQSVLGGPSVVRGRRAPQALSRRAFVSADSSKRAPVFSLSRARVHRDPLARCVEGYVVHGHGGAGQFWDRLRDNYSYHQCDSAWRLHLQLSLASSSCRRRMRSIIEDAGPSENLQLRELFESPPHALGLDEPFLGGVLRHLCAAVFDGYLVRQENLLMAEYQTFEHDVLVIGA